MNDVSTKKCGTDRTGPEQGSYAIAKRLLNIKALIISQFWRDIFYRVSQMFYVSSSSCLCNQKLYTMLK